jgi:hypothetical protein
VDIVARKFPEKYYSMENMSVLFQPVAAEQESASGMTDSAGRFVLKQVFSDKTGIEPGDYCVFISWQNPTPRTEFDKTPPLACPYSIPVSAGNGSIVKRVESQGFQTLEFELSEFQFSVD